MKVTVVFTRAERAALREAADLLASQADSSIGYAADLPERKRLYRYAETLDNLLKTTEKKRP